MKKEMIYYFHISKDIMYGTWIASIKLRSPTGLRKKKYYFLKQAVVTRLASVVDGTQRNLNLKK